MEAVQGVRAALAHDDWVVFGDDVIRAMPGTTVHLFVTTTDGEEHDLGSTRISEVEITDAGGWVTFDWPIGADVELLARAGQFDITGDAGLIGHVKLPLHPHVS
jgi:hypothetical protein